MVLFINGACINLRLWLVRTFIWYLSWMLLLSHFV